MGRKIFLKEYPRAANLRSGDKAGFRAATELFGVAAKEGGCLLQAERVHDRDW